VSQHEIAKNLLKTFLDFKVIHVSTPGMLVSSACYDKQQVCVYLQRYRYHARLVDSSKNRAFSRGYPNLMYSYGELLS